MLDSRQYGFRQNRSAVDVLHEVERYISESKRVSQYSCLISLDVNNAFNSARWTDLLRLLAERDVPSDLDSFLWNRSIISNTNEHYFNVGVPQGSCLEPILWLVLINSLLKRLRSDEA